jgi:hypothetical protein
VVAHVVHQLADDHDPRVRLERRAHLGAIVRRGFDEADRGDLLEVGAVVVRALELACAAHAEMTVRVDDGVAPLDGPVGAVASDEHFPQTHLATFPISE